MANNRYLIKEIRERKTNEFLFGCSERVVASSEIKRLFMYLKDVGFKIKEIDQRSLPQDNHGDRLVGYEIINPKGEGDDNE